MSFQQYLRTTSDPDLPILKKDVRTEKGYNGARCDAFMKAQSAFLNHPLVQKGFHTGISAAANIQDPGLQMIMRMNPAAYVSMMLQNQICSTCKLKEAPLYTCTCCGLFQVCSKECLTTFKEKNGDHKSTLQRFF